MFGYTFVYLYIREILTKHQKCAFPARFPCNPHKYSLPVIYPMLKKQWKNIKNIFSLPSEYHMRGTQYPHAQKIVKKHQKYFSLPSEYHMRSTKYPHEALNTQNEAPTVILTAYTPCTIPQNGVQTAYTLAQYPERSTNCDTHSLYPLHKVPHNN
jgi:hypothetical protein